MMTQSLDDIIRSKMHNGEIFTAYDISREFQRKHMFVRHLNLKDKIHQSCESMMSTYGMKKKLVLLKNGKNAWVYYFNGDNPHDHPFAVDVTTSNVSQVVSSQPSYSQPRTPLLPLPFRTQTRWVDKPNICGLGYEGRMSIPAKVIKYLGATESVTFYKTNDNKLKVYDSYDVEKLKIHDHLRNIGNYNVDLNNNVKISKYRLEEVFSSVDLSDKFKVTEDFDSTYNLRVLTITKEQ